MINWIEQSYLIKFNKIKNLINKIINIINKIFLIIYLKLQKFINIIHKYDNLTKSNVKILNKQVYNCHNIYL